MKIEVSQEEKDRDKKKEKKPLLKKIYADSELRQDIVTGDWVVIATGRAKRPEDFSKNEYSTNSLDNDTENCLFCYPAKSKQEKDTLIYSREDGEWTLRVFPNKYPAFSRGRVHKPVGEGPYFAMTGSGYHEVIVTRDHFKHFPDLTDIEVAEVFDAYQDRYLSLMNKKSVNYITIFHNYGKEAGASIAHPHSQLMAIPVISPYIRQELNGAEIYYKSNKRCVYCTIADYESKNKSRIVFENDKFIAFCPFSSRIAFEIWVMPKNHEPYFERITEEDKLSLAEVFRKALLAIKNTVNNPPYNFYIHTSPCDGKDYRHYHWHIEILPHTSTWAGFELETGIEISIIEPEKAAEALRKNLN
ncbi:MAG: galactose-1-phosphate uridylyltransferase [Candidatus Moranbacteria bacterium]|nr:galactose-1-phosphate uridylyltransferase [Candidatus Moranbacteria bacterium]